MLDASGAQHLLLAETLGLAMARRASDILDRHRAALAGGEAAREDDDAQFALDNAIFTAVLDAANECLGRFDARPADDRWCDALLQVLNLAGLAELTRLSPSGRPRLRAAKPGLTGGKIYYYYHRKYSKPRELPRAGRIMALPDFLVAGVPKAGTTALHAALSRHPGLYLSPVKEPKFFLTDGPPPTRGGPGDALTYREHVWQRDRYEALFAAAPPGALRGEATPFYLYDPGATGRIRGLIPDVKLIVVIRDPVERAHSNWTHLWSAGLEPVGDFVQACAEEDRRIAAGWAPFWHYVGLGRYGEQLARAFSLFPREQVLVLRYRLLIDDPAATLSRICAFLGVKTGVLSEIPRENVTAHPERTLAHRAVSLGVRASDAVGRLLPGSAATAATHRLERFLQRGRRERQPLGWEQRQAILPRFTADIKLLEAVLGEDFSDWTAPRDRSGNMVGARQAGQAQAKNGFRR